MVFLIAGRLFYLKGIAGITETTAKRKAISDLKLESEKTPVFKAYIKKEIKLLFRSPTAFLQCILATFIWPVLIMIVLFSGGGENFSLMKTLIAGMDSGLLVAILSSLSAFITSANSITSTAVSREGKGLYFTKYIPVSMKKQLHAKAVTGVILSCASVALFTAAIGALIEISVAEALVSAVLGAVIGAACSYAGLLIDIANPKLEWINEQQAIKQNMNVIRHLFAGLAFGALAVVPAAVFEMDMALSAVYIFAAFTLLTALFVKRVNGKASEKMIDMDV
jgi:ABC-2 type transport system permease protein